MNIKPIYSGNLNFGKTLIASANVRKTDDFDSFEKLNLVEYKPDDKDDAKQLNHLEILWSKGARFIDTFLNSFKLAASAKNIKLPDGSFILKNAENPVKYSYLGLEDENENVLALAEIVEATDEFEDDYENEIEIALIQVAPKELYGSKERQYRGLGKVLVSKIVEMAKAKNKDAVVTMSENDDFWRHSTIFKECGGESNFCLKSEDFDKYIEYANL